MGFRLNTNIGAMNAHVSALATNRKISSSLEKLSSGLRINKAADDASGMAIADSLRAQAKGLGQAIRNANDAVGILQTADKGIDEQVKILDTIRTKATQAAQDGQTVSTRKALQADIVRLMEELDNIAGTTSFNGQQLLSGQFTNKEFQIGAYSNTVVKTSIGATSSDKIGQTRFETTNNITKAENAQLTFKAVDGVHDIKLESVTISNSAGTGIGVLAETINKNSDKTGVRASWQVLSTGSDSITKGTIESLTINGVKFGTISVADNDNNGKLVAAINEKTDETGVEAFVDNRGRLNLRSLDGRGIIFSAASGADTVAHIEKEEAQNYGRLTLTKLSGRDIVVSDAAGAIQTSYAQTTINLRNIKQDFTADQASAIGAHANLNVENVDTSITAGVTTLKGAMAVMDIAQSAQEMLDRIRSDIGSTQNQLMATIDNISVAQVNVKSSESQIRDVDFAAESANFNKENLLAKSGAYAMSQANAVQQNVMKLLQ
jgi:flagellin